MRAVGSDLRMDDYSAVGRTTHLAARMEQIAAPETITLTPATLARAGGFIVVKSLGATPVKGLAKPIEVYEPRVRFSSSGARRRALIWGSTASPSGWSKRSRAGRPRS